MTLSRFRYLYAAWLTSQQLINGLQLGAVYALIALGYTMVYGIVRLINFAHGDVFMVGAYLGFLCHRPVPVAVSGRDCLRDGRLRAAGDVH